MLYRSFTRTISIIFIWLTLNIPLTKAADLLFLVDASNSMRAMAKDESQIDSVREAINESLNKLAYGTNVGLRVFGNYNGTQSKEEECINSELLVPVQPLSKEGFAARLNDILPHGGSPLAFSLNEAKGDFPPLHDARRIVILISDSGESCGGDPVAVVRKQIDKEYQKIYAIGFKPSESAKQTLQSIAQAGGGYYLEAKDTPTLTESIEEILEKSSMSEKKKLNIEEISGGASFEAAKGVTLNTEFKLNHHQKIHDYDFFSIFLQSGQELKVVMSTEDKGVRIQPDGNFVEDSSPYAGVIISDPKRKQIIERTVLGRKFGREESVITAQEDGVYYIQLGNDYGDQHKDGVVYKISIEDSGDGNTKMDASDKSAEAIQILPGKYDKNFLGGADKKDVFQFKGISGDKVVVGLIPDDESNAEFVLEIYNEYKQVFIKDFSQERGEGFKTEPFFLPEDGNYYIQVSLKEPLEEIERYKLELTVTHPDLASH